MNIKEVHKFVIKTEKRYKVIETTATEKELKDLYHEYQLNINQIVLPELKNKTVINTGNGTRKLNQSELDERMETAKNLDYLYYFRTFVQDNGFIFTIIVES